MAVIRELWDYHEGYAVYLYTLTYKNFKIRLSNYGATLVGIDVPDRDGTVSDVVLGYSNLSGYIKGKSFHGAVVGRYANRIAGARFSLNGTEHELAANDGENSLHGGHFGFNRRIFETETYDENQSYITFKYRSQDGEEGFPGRLDMTVTYRIHCGGDGYQVKIEYTGQPNADTIFNPTNHAYFNLRGSGDSNILGTLLQINAVNYTPFDAFNIPTGEIEPVFDTPFNFTKPKKIGADIETGKLDNYDHNFLLSGIGEKRRMQKAAVAYDPESGRIMAVFTDMPAIQLYTAKSLDEVGKRGIRYKKYHGFCLETQFTPNTPNLPDFPPCLVKKYKKFKSTTVYAFGIK
ncbi:MAG: galactose mutarotase [Oscillospiraceae bacterium]|nr:galactose mutarotase [Oscillospiraceae bacterium]